MNCTVFNITPRSTPTCSSTSFPVCHNLRRHPKQSIRFLSKRRNSLRTSSRKRLNCTSYLEDKDVDPQSAPEKPVGDVLLVKTIRPLLTERKHPFQGDPNLAQGFVDDGDWVSLKTVNFKKDRNAEHGGGSSIDEDDYVLPDWGIRAGPRETIWFDPPKVTAAILTTGGVCPGTNLVVHNIARMLHDYGVCHDQVLGIPFGFRGLNERSMNPIPLLPSFIQDFPRKGGSILGTSRDSADISAVVRRIKLWELDMLFVIGGHKGNEMVSILQEELEKQEIACAVVGVPKSMDNTLPLVDKSFGFDSAVSEAQHALRAAGVEALSARNGIGLVKLMGKCSGLVSVAASMASGTVDICLIPEIPFTMDMVCNHVAKLFKEKSHCVICLAEGAMDGMVGNSMEEAHLKSHEDPGLAIKSYLQKHFNGDVDVKYIDPTYIIRAGQATSSDGVYCKVLGQAAVHTAFSGYTGVTVGMVNSHYVLMPADRISNGRRTVNPDGRRWNRWKFLMDGVQTRKFPASEYFCMEHGLGLTP